MKLPLEDEFGDIVQKARQGKGFAIEKLARDIELEPHRLERLEAYDRPTPDEIGRLAAALGLHSEKLRNIALGLWHPDHPELLASDRRPIERVTYDRWRVHCYIVGDEDENGCIVIDPGAQPDIISETIERASWRPIAILATHGHHDHVGAVASLQAAWDCPVLIHGADLEALDGVPRSVIRTIADDEEVEIGPFLVTVLHVPGHTAGSVAYLVDDAVFTGDILFAGSVGRANLGPGSYERLLEGVERKLFTLSGDTRMFPGHGTGTTIEQEWQHNPFFP